MTQYIWCEDSGSGYQLWHVLFHTLYPNAVVETKRSNSRMSKAVQEISNDGNMYYIIIDAAVDNPDVLRELSRLKRLVLDKNNVKIIKVHSFEFALLSFEFLEDWIFASDDELRGKRKKLMDARKLFLKLIINGGDTESLAAFKSEYNLQSKKNTEKISSSILFELTRNTGFETDKSHIGPCFINSCCEWNSRQDDDICGLDSHRLTINDKMRQIVEHSVLQGAFQEVGL